MSEAEVRPAHPPADRASTTNPRQTALQNASTAGGRDLHLTHLLEATLKALRSTNRVTADESRLADQIAGEARSKFTGVDTDPHSATSSPQPIAVQPLAVSTGMADTSLATSCLATSVAGMTVASPAQLDLLRERGWCLTRADRHHIRASWRVVSADFDTFVAVFWKRLLQPDMPELLRKTLPPASKTAMHFLAIFHSLVETLREPHHLLRTVHGWIELHRAIGVAHYEHQFKPLAENLPSVLAQLSATGQQRAVVEASWAKLWAFLGNCIRHELSDASSSSPQRALVVPRVPPPTVVPRAPQSPPAELPDVMSEYVESSWLESFAEKSISISASAGDLQFDGTQGKVPVCDDAYQAFSATMELIPLPQKVLDAVVKKEFNIFDVVDWAKKLESRTGGGTPWAYMACGKLCLHLFTSSGLPSKLGVATDSLQRLLYLAMRKYKESVSYHNFVHATDVLQTTYVFLFEGACAALLSPLQQYTLLLAALFHDMGHTGLNNAFHLKTETTVGVVTASVGSSSVMELRHCGIMASLLEEVPEACGAATTPTERKWIQKALVRLILATDMARHMELVSLFETTIPTPDAYLGNKAPGDPAAAEAERLFEAERTTSGTTVQEEHALCAMDTILKMADISNVAKPHKVARRWASLVTEEFYRQGDAERLLGLEPIPNFDRRQGGSATALAQSQLGFIRFMVLPMYTSCHAHLFSGLLWWVDGLQRNIELYEQEVASDGRIVSGVATSE